MRFVAVVLFSAAAFAQTDWPAYNHDLAGTRYSPLRQITRKMSAN